jgi:hypothetical protein
MNDPQATQFLKEIRKPLLALHKAILDHERAIYEKEFGSVTPAAFLQVLINGAAFQWVAPLSTVIANVDETLDDEEATSSERLASVQTVAGLFSQERPDNLFLHPYRQLLQTSATVLHEHGRVAQLLRQIET